MKQRRKIRQLDNATLACIDSTIIKSAYSKLTQILVSLKVSPLPTNDVEILCCSVIFNSLKTLSRTTTEHGWNLPTNLSTDSSLSNWTWLSISFRWGPKGPEHFCFGRNLQQNPLKQFFILCCSRFRSVLVILVCFDPFQLKLSKRVCCKW